MVWWSWKVDFGQFLILEGVMVLVLKGLIVVHCELGRLQWSFKDLFWTTASSGECCGPERIDFRQLLLWGCGSLQVSNFNQSSLWGYGGPRKDWLWLIFSLGCYGVLKVMILLNFYFGSVCWSWRTYFGLLSFKGDVVVLRRPVMVYCHFGKMLWSWKD